MENLSAPEISGSTAPLDPRDATIAALEMRLETLEKSVARLEKWQRKLKEGTEYLNLGFLRLQGMELHFEEKRRAWLSASEDGADFCLYDGDQQMRVSLAADSSEPYNTGLQLFGDYKRDEVLAAEAAKSPEEKASGAVNMKQYDEAVRLGLGPDGGLLALFDAESKPCVVARGSARGGSVATTNKNGQVLAILTSTAEGGSVQVLPDVWDQLGSEGRIPIVTARLEAKQNGGSCIVRDGSNGPDKGAFATLSAQENRAIFLMGDENCAKRVALAATPQITSFHLQHGEETPRFYASSGPALASLALKDHDGQALGDWVAISDAQSPKERQCALYLKDSGGNSRFGAVATDGFASLRLADETDRDRVSIMVAESAAVLKVSDQNGTDRVSMQADPALLLRDQENRVVGLFDTGTGGRLSLFAAPSPDEDLELVSEAEINGATESGTTEIFKRGTSFLNGPATRQRVVLAANPTGAGLVLHGAHSEEQMLLSVGEITSHLQIKDKDGTPNLDLRATEAGGQIHVLSDSGAPRVVMMVQENCGAVAVMRSGGEFDALLTANEQGGQLLLFDEYNETTTTLPDL